MALKLQVPWTREPLPVALPAGYEEVTNRIAVSGSPHVCQDGADVLVVNFFRECNRVPDVSRYHIGDDGQPFRHGDVPESQLHLQLRSIVLLLESPSVSEYQFGYINYPIAPAKGTTGENIHRCLGKVLSDIKQEFIDAGLDEDTLIEERRIEAKLIEPGDRRVIISNPIQFQTNLRSIHGQSTSRTGNNKWATLRNNVWKTLWRKEISGYIQLYFRARLNTYSPSLIINACTDKLQSHVSRFVQSKLPKVPLYEIYHPSHRKWKGCLRTSWKSCEKIGLNRVYP